MGNDIFAFTLTTKCNLKLGVVFGNQGELVGRILKMYPKFNDAYEEFEYSGNYTYDIESTADTFEKIKRKEIVLDIEEYTVSKCTTWYHK
jgi:hypothetical protein